MGGACSSSDADLTNVDSRSAAKDVTELYENGLQAFNEWLESPTDKIKGSTFTNYHFPFLLSADHGVTTVQTMKMLSNTTLSFWKGMKEKGVTEGKLTRSSVEVTGGSSAKLNTFVQYYNKDGEVVQDVSQQHIYTVIESFWPDENKYKWAATMTLM